MDAVKLINFAHSTGMVRGDVFTISGVYDEPRWRRFLAWIGFLARRPDVRLRPFIVQ